MSEATLKPSQRFTVSHLDEADFKTGGLRNYSAYRDLGIAAATNGLAQAHVIRMVKPFSPVELTRRIESTLPGATVRWHYRLVANGLAVVLPQSQVAALARVRGVAEVWPNVRYHSLSG